MLPFNVHERSQSPPRYCSTAPVWYLARALCVCVCFRLFVCVYVFFYQVYCSTYSWLLLFSDDKTKNGTENKSKPKLKKKTGICIFSPRVIMKTCYELLTIRMWFNYVTSTGQQYIIHNITALHIKKKCCAFRVIISLIKTYWTYF